MAFTENLDTFLADFGNAVVSGGVSYKGILDQPDEIVADGLVMTTDYELTAKTSDLGDLVFDNTLKVNGDGYKVRNTRKIDDGSFCLVSLTKT